MENQEMMMDAQFTEIPEQEPQHEQPQQQQQADESVEIVGDKDAWKVIQHVLFKKKGYIQTTSAMVFSHGHLVRTNTRQLNPDGTFSLSEALCFVPNPSSTSFSL